MSNYNKFGFFKNKFNVAVAQTYDDFYPQYPNLPDATKLYSTLRIAYRQNANAVSNVNTTLGNTMVSSFSNNLQFTMPDGNVAMPTISGPNFENLVFNLYKYDADAGNVVKLTPTLTARRNYGTNPISFELQTNNMTNGCLCYDGNVRIYNGQGFGGNNRWFEMKTDYSDVKFIINKSNGSAPGLIEDGYPGARRVLALDGVNKSIIFSAFGAAFSGTGDPVRARIVLHNFATDKFETCSLTYDNAAANVQQAADVTVIPVQVPGTGSGNTSNIYCIPGQGWLVNGTDTSNPPAQNGPRCIVEYDPGSNVTTRFTPTGANLQLDASFTGSGNEQRVALYGAATLGVDGKIYCFPGTAKKDIMVVDAVNKTAVQSKFSIYTSSTLYCPKTVAVLAPDGFAYARVTDITGFDDGEDAWLGIDTNPTSDTYQTGVIIPIDPTGVVKENYNPFGYAIAKDGLILGQVPQGDSMTTLQISGNGLDQQAIYPALIGNSTNNNPG